MGTEGESGIDWKNLLANFVSVHFNLLSYPITILSLERELLPSVLFHSALS